jgi:hypothetical protein
VSFKVLADFLPESLRMHTMATTTEMMKDRTVVESVIQKQKLEKNERNYRVFQAMRLMRREYMKMLLVDNLSEDGTGSEYSSEERTVSMHSEALSSETAQIPANNKRLKEDTVKHIMENF